VASFGLSIETGMRWMAIGCVAGTFIDLDHFIYALVAFRGEAWNIIKKGVAEPRQLLRELERKGKLRYHVWRRMTLHVVTMLSVYALSLSFFPSYSLVIGVVFVAHLALDIKVKWLRY
jgi:hypothetical protein